MSLVIALLLSYFFLDWPWSLLVVIPAAGLEAFEIWLYFRWRKVKAISGHQTLIGERGKTVGVCDPTGQANIRGQVWTVECDERLERGAEVEVVDMDGLRLKVKRAES
jgi:membrane-bound serine protease (ClpP class)